MAATTPENDESQGPEIVSEFPKPPSFFELYKDGKDSGPSPPTPMSPTYHMFGTPYSTKDVVPDLLPQEKKVYLDSSSSSSISQDTIDFKLEMKKLNASLLANFVELIDILVVNPAHFNEKLSDLELLFLNLHNLINAFRPHQARETLIEILRNQIEEGQQATREILQTVDEETVMIQTAHDQLYLTEYENKQCAALDSDAAEALLLPSATLDTSTTLESTNTDNVATAADHVELFQQLSLLV